MKRATLCLCLWAIAPLFAEKADIRPQALARELVDASGCRGAVLLYDFEAGAYFASHPTIADERFIPASTFKILSTQAALQSGVIESSDTVMTWDGVKRGRAATNRDLDLTTAFRISSVPHYQALARKIGPARMQAFIDSIPYGNQKITGGADQFWLTGDLRISPREQIEFLRRLYLNDLPFDRDVMDSVKTMMQTPAAGPIRYSAKTGWATLPENRNVGWWVGWAQLGEKLLFFATVLDSNAPPTDFGAMRIAITKTAVEKHFAH